MGQIIALPSSREPARQAPAGGSAEILFFLGVRYHRMSDEEFAEVTAARPSRAAKRKPATPKVAGPMTAAAAAPARM